MQDDVKLEPCPHCGCSDLNVIPIRDGYRIHCAGCSAAGPMEFHGPSNMPSSRDRAIAGWNRRALRPVRVTEEAVEAAMSVLQINGRGPHVFDKDRMRQALRAALAMPGVVEGTHSRRVGVKPLEWKDKKSDPWDGSPIYETRYGSGLIEYKIVTRDEFWVCFNPSGEFQTPEEAKAACQADYEARIRSALTGGEQ